MRIGDRRVFLRTGPKTQTVSVCDANNRRGDYDWVIRIFAPAAATEAELVGRADIDDLVAWLKDTKRGKVEKSPPPDADADEDREPLPPPPDEDAPWIERAVEAVEQAIDRLVREFLRAPYLHRVEHSLHARLFAILAEHELFRDEVDLNGGRYKTQAIHKEWPETIPEEGCRRGNFDLAILPPLALYQCGLEEFRNGRISAPIVIEMGLDYGAAHLADDADKLIHSAVPHGYLVHFTRKPRDEEAENRILDPGGGDHVRAAFASVSGGPRHKLVRGVSIVDGMPVPIEPEGQA